MSFSSKKTKRLSMPGSSSLYTISDYDPGSPSSGFLNKKILQEATGKRSKDRQWQTVWCQLKEKKMDFYKVAGISLKPHGEPPPKDIYPPPNRQQTKLSSVDIEGASLEIDYSSQRDKDLDKRRKHLFRLTLTNKMEFLFQAASEHQMQQWIAFIKRHTLSYDAEGEENDFFRIKASRCSINKKSKHNTNSVRVLGRDETDIDGGHYAVSLSDLDPRLVLLKERLQRKRELIKHLDKMMKSFSGETASLYKEFEPANQRVSQSVSSEDPGSQRTSKTDSTNRTSRLAVTKLLSDYYLVPGVEWSLLKKGERVEVLQKLPNGWYKCRALRTADCKLIEIPPTDIYREGPASPEGDSKEKDEENQEKEDVDQGEGEEEGHKNEEETEEGEDEESKSPSHRLRTDSYMVATTDFSLLKSQKTSRNNSYKVATRGYADSIKGRPSSQQFHRLSVGTPLYKDEDPEEPPDIEMVRLRVRVLINSERENSNYSFPLVGSIPPSVLLLYANEALGYNPASNNTSTVAPDNNQTSPPKDGYNEPEESPASVSQVEDAVPTEGGASSYLDMTSSHSYTSSLSPSNSSSQVDPSSADPTNTSADEKQTTTTPGIDIPARREEEDDMLPPSSLEIGSVPSQLLRNHHGRGLNENEPIESSLDKSRQSRATSLPVGIDDEAIQEHLERMEEVHSPDLSVLEEEDDSAFEINNPPKRRPSKTLKVVPSPTSTLERKLGGGGGGGRGGGEHVTFKELPKSPSKNKSRSRSEDIQKKGILGRIRSNLLGHKKKVGKPPSGSDGFDDDIGDMRSRVTSISGKAIRSRGMEVTFGDSSSDSESEETERKQSKDESGATSEEASPLPSKKLENETQKPDTHPMRESLGKSYSSPIPSHLKSKSHSAFGEGGEIVSRKRLESRSFSSRNLYDGSKILGYIQAPPKRVKRHIYLDPTESKYGLHLACYDVHKDQGNIPRAIVQHVAPGSPAFVAGLYPGDQILKINDIDVSQARVSEIVDLIQNTEKDKRLDLLVAYVDGVHRLEVQAKGVECRENLRDRQKQLSELVSTYGEVSSVVTPPFSPVPLLSPSSLDVSAWSHESLSDEESSLHIYPYERRLNKILAITSDDVTQLHCDMLFIPLRSTPDVQTVLRAGGEKLMDELSSADHPPLGENIVTSGHNLRAQVVCHAVFGDSEDDIISCCRSALETAYEQEYKSIVIWVEGFILAAHVPPSHIISSVRGWLEEGDNKSFFDQLVFSVLSTPAIINLIERYFPLDDYERDEKLEALNYCTDSEDDEDDGNTGIDTKRFNTRPRLPSGPPPLLPPKPSSFVPPASLISEKPSNPGGTDNSGTPSLSAGKPLHSLNTPQSTSKGAVSESPLSSRQKSPLSFATTATPPRVASKPPPLLSKKPSSHSDTTSPTSPPSKRPPLIAPKPGVKSPPMSPSKPPVAPRPGAKSPPMSPTKPPVAPKPGMKSPPMSPTKPPAAPKPGVKSPPPFPAAKCESIAPLKSPPPELVIAPKSKRSTSSGSVTSPSVTSPNSDVPTTKTPMVETASKSLLSPKNSLSPDSLSTTSSVAKKHSKPVSKDSLLMNLSELDSIMSDIDLTVASISNSQ
ncbi:PREDICTED: uncharacterized protein LOC109583893 isoform X2 [Amphimedon queenslandica]|uniref:Uncharacterized protein n=1 Tax=Amphimedon queenslandica TaxID=400682 RepID=A0AAN0JD87_AMPQE|nr:PREDICTED: uncharacterized protein LOC109583893 isoform X2 [Amphimedon queenslandica]|eukprot:XP_019854959.1 PREDICTED: uncharacterized protein LOC109583893 isoform X2 [Amphimedon queenslandica]